MSVSISEEMVEIGAKAMHARLRNHAWPDHANGGSWDPEPNTYQISHDAKERYRANSRACLTAALSEERVGVVVPKDVYVDFIKAVTAEVNEKGAGGYLLARLSDARKYLP
jgi:hypothetical protein